MLPAMSEPASTIPAMAAPPPARDNPLTRSVAGLIGLAVLCVLLLACLGTLPWTLTGPGPDAPPRFDNQLLTARHLPPSWIPLDPERDADEITRLERTGRELAAARLLEERLAALRAELLPEGWAALDAGARAEALAGMDPSRREAAAAVAEGQLPPGETAPAPTPEQIERATPGFPFGSDALGRDLLIRCLAGGGVSIGIGIAAAAIAVCIGTIYGALAGYAGGRVDAVLMRIVDVLYGLPYILLVVLLAVAGDALIDEHVSRKGARAAWMIDQAQTILEQQGAPSTRADARTLLENDPAVRASLQRTIEGVDRLQPRELSGGLRTTLEVAILLTAIGGVSWLTMARVIRGQVLSLKEQPFMEAARAAGVPLWRQFFRHLLPNLLGPVIVYATLIVPQAILQESFLSFLGIGVKPPLPSWGNLAADGLIELNTYKARWWLLLFPCLLLGTTLLALNFVGEGLREALDPRRARRRDTA
jgi:oligopeptide transport system permease protein